MMMMGTGLCPALSSKLPISNGNQQQSGIHLLFCKVGMLMMDTLWDPWSVIFYDTAACRGVVSTMRTLLHALTVISTN
jgi:hypothetical protein